MPSSPPQQQRAAPAKLPISKPSRLPIPRKASGTFSNLSLSKGQVGGSLRPQFSRERLPSSNGDARMPTPRSNSTITKRPSVPRLPNGSDQGGKKERLSFLRLHDVQITTTSCKAISFPQTDHLASRSEFQRRYGIVDCKSTPSKDALEWCSQWHNTSSKGQNVFHQFAGKTYCKYTAHPEGIRVFNRISSAITTATHFPCFSDSERKTYFGYKWCCSASVKPKAFKQPAQTAVYHPY